MSYEGLDNGFSKFNDREDRLNFVRKVYGILGFQLALSAAIISIPMTSDKARIWIDTHWGLMIAAMVLSIVVSCTMICCLQLTRMVPINYVLMTIFTLCEAYMLAGIAAKYDQEVVIQAAVTTAGVTLALTMFACFTSADFVLIGPILVLILSLSLCMSMMFMFVFMFNKLHTFYCMMGVIIYSIYLIVDTQLIMGGKRYEIELDDYILGAIILYTDIVMLFLYLIQLFGRK